MDTEIRKYLADIGRRGGQKSRRSLDRETARNMVKIREVRRAFREFYASCFWSYDPDYMIQFEDVPWVAEQLKRHGGRKGWEVGARLCH